MNKCSNEDSRIKARWSDFWNRKCQDTVKQGTGNESRGDRSRLCDEGDGRPLNVESQVDNQT